MHRIAILSPKDRGDLFQETAAHRSIATAILETFRKLEAEINKTAQEYASAHQ